MELGTQIKQHRKKQGWSQDELAEKIFVSRQSISNWENGKTYPDIHSLLLLSDVFAVSLDELIKGDVMTMKEEITLQERKSFQRDSTIFTLLLSVSILSLAPLFAFLDWVGIGIWAFIFGSALYFCGRVELYKKQFNIQTYEEILAFQNGASLDDIDALRDQRTSGRLRKILTTLALMLAAAAIGGAIAYGSMALLDHLGIF